MRDNGSPGYRYRPYPGQERVAVIPESMTCDKNLSDAGHRLLTYLLQNSGNWIVYQNYTRNQLGWGRDKLRQTNKELEQLGYIKRVQVKQHKGRFGHFVYEYSSKPIFFSQSPDPEYFNDEDAPTHTFPPSPENPAPEVQGTERGGGLPRKNALTSTFPPSPENPAPEVQAHTIYNISIDRDININKKQQQLANRNDSSNETKAAAAAAFFENSGREQQHPKPAKIPAPQTEMRQPKALNKNHSLQKPIPASEASDSPQVAPPPLTSRPRIYSCLIWIDWIPKEEKEQICWMHSERKVERCLGKVLLKEEQGKIHTCPMSYFKKLLNEKDMEDEDYHLTEKVTMQVQAWNERLANFEETYRIAPGARVFFQGDIVSIPSSYRNGEAVMKSYKVSEMSNGKVILQMKQLLTEYFDKFLEYTRQNEGVARVG